MNYRRCYLCENLASHVHKRGPFWLCETHRDPSVCDPCSGEGRLVLMHAETADGVYVCEECFDSCDETAVDDPEATNGCLKNEEATPLPITRGGCLMRQGQKWAEHLQECMADQGEGAIERSWWPGHRLAAHAGDRWERPFAPVASCEHCGRSAYLFDLRRARRASGCAIYLCPGCSRGAPR